MAPQDFSIRFAKAEDHQPYTQLLPEIGTDLTVLSPEDWRAEMMPTTLVACDREGVVGYCYFQPLSGVGYVRHVVAARRARRQGVARTLMLAAAQALRAQGCTLWELNVEPQNMPATTLYQSLGMRCAYPSTAIRWPWTSMENLTGDAFSVRVCAPESDAALEKAFALLPGQMSNLRQQARRVLLRVDDAQSCVGFAAFDPGFPGAFPFKVQPRAVRALLAAIRPHAAAGNVTHITRRRG